MDACTGVARLCINRLLAAAAEGLLIAWLCLPTPGDIFLEQHNIALHRLQLLYTHAPVGIFEQLIQHVIQVGGDVGHQALDVARHLHLCCPAIRLCGDLQGHAAWFSHAAEATHQQCIQVIMHRPTC